MWELIKYKGYISYQQISNIRLNYESKGCLSGSFRIQILLAIILRFTKATKHIAHKAWPAMTKSHGIFFFGHVESLGVESGPQQPKTHIQLQIAQIEKPHCATCV